MRKQHIFIMSRIEDLDKRMRLAQATNEALSEKSGVCLGTIQKARNGEPILSTLASFVEEALDKYQYKYTKRGRKPYGAGHEQRQ